jgi:hypothetical protein
MIISWSHSPNVFLSLVDELEDMLVKEKYNTTNSHHYSMMKISYWKITLRDWRRHKKEKKYRGRQHTKLRELYKIQLDGFCCNYRRRHVGDACVYQ